MTAGCLVCLGCCQIKRGIHIPANVHIPANISVDLNVPTMTTAIFLSALPMYEFLRPAQVNTLTRQYCC